VTAVATMVLAAIFFATSPLLVNMMTLPLAIGGACIITSIIGTFFVKLGASQSIMGALYKGLIATGILSLLAVGGVINWLIGFGPLAGVKYTGMALFECGVVGLVVTGLIIWITEYYTGTDYRPVKSIAASSVTGHGTNVIQGLAISMESTAGPALVIIAGILVTYSLAGLFGIAIATTTMLALAGMIVALDAFGPSPTTPAALPKWPACRRKCARPPTRSTRSATPPRRSPRVTRSAPPVSAHWCCSRPTMKTSSSSSPTPPSIPTSRACCLTSRSTTLRRGGSAVRRSAAVSVRRDGHDGRRPCG